MSLAEKLKAAKFTSRTIEGVGAVRIRHVKVGEMFELGAEKDRQKSYQRLVHLCVYEGESPLFGSADEVAQCDWPIVKSLADAAMEVNRISEKDAEKKSTTPPSSP